MKPFRKQALLLLAAILTPLAGRAAEPSANAIELLASGVQIYTCAVTPEGAAWKLKAPEATLRDSSGHVVGQHFAGPTWQAKDGSKVVGAVQVLSAASGPPAIPWLVLRATANDGTGVFARVTYIVRSRTIGGTAPAKGCDAAHEGIESRVRYSANYTFFTPNTP